MTTFNTWLNTFIEEKNIDTDITLEVEGGVFGTNFIPVKVVIDEIKRANKEEQQQIKNTLVKIDFLNGDVLHFLQHLAKALAI